MAACVAVAIALAVVWTFTQTPIYTATAEILVKPALGTSLGGTVPPFNIENELQIVESLPVASLAQRNIDTTADARSLLRSVDVVVPKDADVLQIHFQHTDPKVAQEGAEALARQRTSTTRSSAPRIRSMRRHNRSATRSLS